MQNTTPAERAKRNHSFILSMPAIGVLGDKLGGYPEDVTLAEEAEVLKYGRLEAFTKFMNQMLGLLPDGLGLEFTEQDFKRLSALYWNCLFLHRMPYRKGMTYNRHYFMTIHGRPVASCNFFNPGLTCMPEPTPLFQVLEAGAAYVLLDDILTGRVSDARSIARKAIAANNQPLGGLDLDAYIEPTPQ